MNAGIGAPFVPPLAAHWLLLGPDMRLRQTAYDLRGAAERMRTTGFPQVETAAVPYLVQPPPETEMLAAYARADD